MTSNREFPNFLSSDQKPRCEFGRENPFIVRILQRRTVLCSFVIGPADFPRMPYFSFHNRSFSTYGHSDLLVTSRLPASNQVGATMQRRVSRLIVQTDAASSGFMWTDTTTGSFSMRLLVGPAVREFWTVRIRLQIFDPSVRPSARPPN